MMITFLTTSSTVNAQSCPALLPEQTGVFLDVDDHDGLPTSGCAPIRYCFRVQLEGNEPFEGATLSLERPPVVTSNIEKLIPVNLNGFSVDPVTNEYSRTLTIPPSIDGTEYCIDFRLVDNIGGINIRTLFVLTMPEPCSYPAVSNLLTTGDALRIIGDNGISENLSDIISEQDPRLKSADEAAQSSQKVLIRGTLVIDIPEEYIFSHPSQLRMGQGAKIIVKNGSHLTFEGNFENDNDPTFIRGCYDMWEGIEVESGGSLTIREEARVEDAIRAIDAAPGSTITITDSEFIDNQVSVYSSNAEGINWTIENNIFRTEELLSPHTDKIGEAGFDIVNAGINSNPNPAPNEITPFVVFNNNEFRNLANGIMARNSNIMVFGGLFEDMLETNDYSTEGNGIYFYGGADGNTLIQVGRGKDLSNPTFDNCETGIFVFNGHSLIQNNGMVNMGKGTSNVLCRNKATSITNTAISASKIGMNFFVNQPQLPGSQVVNNDIIIDGNITTSTGIRVKDVPVGNGFIFEDNQIDVQTARFGMDISGVSNTDLKRNNIRLENEGLDIVGIQIEGGDDLEVECNRVSKTNTTLDANQYGIRFSSVDDSFFECNDFENVRYGISLDDDNSSTLIQGNTFERYYHGLLLKSQTILPEHINRGNIWGTAFDSNTGGVFHEGDILTLSQTKFEADDDDNSTFVPNLTNIATIPSDWFKEKSSPLPFYSCPTGNICPDLSNEEWIPKEIDEIIATGGPISTEYAEEQLWKAQRSLFERLEQNPQWVLVNQVLKDFMDENGGGTQIRILSEVRKEVEAITGSNDNTKQIIDFIRARTDELQNGFSSSNSSQSPLAQSLIAEISVAQNDLANLVQIIDDNLYNSLDAIGSSLDFSTDKIYIENERVVREIYLASLEAENENIYTTAEKTQLENIAFQCPFTGGNAVYLARGMLGLVNTFDNDVLCANAQNSIAPFNNNLNAEIVSFDIYPNPAKEFFKVTFDTGLKQTENLLIINSLGQIVKTQIIEEGNNHVDVSTIDIPTGMYFIKIDGQQPKLLNIVK